MAENNNCMCRKSCRNNMIEDRGCGCVGYGYVPVQEMEDVYGTDKAIIRGTVFPELDLSICEYGCVCKQWGGTDDE